MAWLSKVLAIGVSVAAVLSWAAPYFSPTYTLLYYAGMAWPAVLFCLLSITLYLALRREKWGLLPTLFLLAGLPQIKHTYNWQKPLAETKPQLKVLSFNSCLIAFPYDRMTPALAEKTRTFFQNTDAHVLCLQEFNPQQYHAERMIARLHLQEMYPFLYRPKGLGVMICCKYPILNQGDTKIWKAGNGAIYADLDTPLGVIRVFSIHLRSNLVSDRVDNLLSTDAAPDNRKQEVKHLLSRVHDLASVRLSQAQTVRDFAEKSPYPVILCGDFNETPLSRTYKTLSTGRRDAFLERGSGWGTTYRGKIPFLRIDYMLSHVSLKPLRFERLSAPNSDHFALLTTYSKLAVE